MPTVLNLQKLDRRYGGHDRFSHRVEFSVLRRDYHSVRSAWVKCRNWLWTTYGPSAEVTMAVPLYFDDLQPKWAWDSDKFVVYLSDEALTAFLLKKEIWEGA
jgi:hypothetical protein